MWIFVLNKEMLSTDNHSVDILASYFSSLGL